MKAAIGSLIPLYTLYEVIFDTKRVQDGTDTLALHVNRIERTSKTVTEGGIGIPFFPETNIFGKDHYEPVTTKINGYIGARLNGQSVQIGDLSVKDGAIHIAGGVQGHSLLDPVSSFWHWGNEDLTMKIGYGLQGSMNVDDLWYEQYLAKPVWGVVKGIAAMPVQVGRHLLGNGADLVLGNVELRDAIMYHGLGGFGAFNPQEKGTMDELFLTPMMVYGVVMSLGLGSEASGAKGFSLRGSMTKGLARIGESVAPKLGWTAAEVAAASEAQLARLGLATVSLATGMTGLVGNTAYNYQSGGSADWYGIRNGQNWKNAVVGFGAGAALPVGLYVALGGPGTEFAEITSKGAIRPWAVVGNSLIHTAGTLTFANAGLFMLNGKPLTGQQNLALGMFTFGGGIIARGAGAWEASNAFKVNQLAELSKARDVLGVRAGVGAMEDEASQMAFQSAQKTVATLEKLQLQSPGAFNIGLLKAAKIFSAGIGFGNTMAAVNNVLYEPAIRNNENAHKGISPWELTRKSFIGWDFDTNEDRTEIQDGGFNFTRGALMGSALAGFSMLGTALEGNKALTMSIGGRNIALGKYITMAGGGAAVNLIRGGFMTWRESKQLGDEKFSVWDYLFSRRGAADAAIGGLIGLGGAYLKTELPSSWFVNSETGAVTWKDKLFNVGVYTMSSVGGGLAARNLGGGWEKYDHLGGPFGALGIDALIGFGAGWVTASSVKWANSIVWGKTEQPGEVKTGGGWQKFWGSEWQPYTYDGYQKAIDSSIFDSDGSLMLGKYLNRVATWGTAGRLAGGTAFGALGGGLVYWMDPTLNKAHTPGHTLGDYITFGAKSGLLLSLLAIARPVLGWWSRGDNSMGLWTLSKRPDIAVKMSIAAALDFGAMMPAWKLVQAPVDILVRSGAQGLRLEKTEPGVGILSQARNEAFSEMNVSAEGFNKTVIDGMVNGYKLGPLLGIFTKPLEVSKGGSVVASNIYQSIGMVGTIGLLSTSQALADAGIRYLLPAQMKKITMEANEEANKLIGADDTQKQAFIKKYIDTKVSGLAQSAAFISLFLIPSAKPQAGDMMRGFASQELADGLASGKLEHFERAADFATLSLKSASEDAPTPEAREANRKSIEEIQTSKRKMTDAGGELKDLLGSIQRIVETVVRSNQTELEGLEAKRKTIADDNNNPRENVGDAALQPILEEHGNNVPRVQDPTHVQAIADNLIQAMGLNGLARDNAVRIAIEAAASELARRSPTGAISGELLARLVELQNKGRQILKIENGEALREDAVKDILTKQARLQSQLNAIKDLNKKIKNIQDKIRKLNGMDSANPESIERALAVLGEALDQEKRDSINDLLKTFKNLKNDLGNSINRGLYIKALHGDLADINDQIRRSPAPETGKLEEKKQQTEVDIQILTHSGRELNEFVDASKENDTTSSDETKTRLKKASEALARRILDKISFAPSEKNLRLLLEQAASYLDRGEGEVGSMSGVLGEGRLGQTRLVDLFEAIVKRNKAEKGMIAPKGKTAEEKSRELEQSRTELERVKGILGEDNPGKVDLLINKSKWFQAQFLEEQARQEEKEGKADQARQTREKAKQLRQEAQNGFDALRNNQSLHSDIRNDAEASAAGVFLEDEKGQLLTVADRKREEISRRIDRKKYTTDKEWNEAIDKEMKEDQTQRDILTERIKIIKGMAEKLGGKIKDSPLVSQYSTHAEILSLRIELEQALQGPLSPDSKEKIKASLDALQERLKKISANPTRLELAGLSQIQEIIRIAGYALNAKTGAELKQAMADAKRLADISAGKTPQSYKQGLDRIFNRLIGQARLADVEVFTRDGRKLELSGSSVDVTKIGEIETYYKELTKLLQDNKDNIAHIRYVYTDNSILHSESRGYTHEVDGVIITRIVTTETAKPHEIAESDLAIEIRNERIEREEKREKREYSKVCDRR